MAGRGSSVQYPFSTDIEEGGIPPNGVQEILVDFDPSYKVDRKSGTVKQRLEPSSEAFEQLSAVRELRLAELGKLGPEVK
ncbi:hypothetical protein AK812_SmicGene25262 [Symbiodinium microadriaticum]|uniref:Uncharacterized protein n=1 Tax=Symbiodinium microadriaticum TaxID=2951 RepID=A0A1Q9DCH4_SYMMI|nr:hypothetical protein AK812_SmicGene25262 [Symbiodinium microadriaticum]